jgi:hypothetical protein
VTIWLLFIPTITMAEYDVKYALQAHASADADNRKVWELIFGNTYNGARWANAALVRRGPSDRPAKQIGARCRRGAAKSAALQIARAGDAPALHNARS